LGKIAHITARIEPKLKAQAGLVPAEVRVPNARTRNAINELQAGDGEAFEGNIRALFDNLLTTRKTRKA
jgi:hypothetical protein